MLAIVFGQFWLALIAPLLSAGALSSFTRRQCEEHHLQPFVLYWAMGVTLTCILAVPFAYILDRTGFRAIVVDFETVAGAGFIYGAAFLMVLLPLALVLLIAIWRCSGSRHASKDVAEREPR